MNKVLVTVISIFSLTNVRGAAEAPSGFKNVPVGQPAAEVSSVDPMDRLTHLEVIVAHLLENNKHLLERVAAVELRNQVLIGQNEELHDRLKVTEVWIAAERGKKRSLRVALQAIPTHQKAMQMRHGSGSAE